MGPNHGFYENNWNIIIFIIIKNTRDGSRFPGSKRAGREWTLVSKLDVRSQSTRAVARNHLAFTVTTGRLIPGIVCEWLQQSGSTWRPRGSHGSRTQYSVSKQLIFSLSLYVDHSAVPPRPPGIFHIRHGHPRGNNPSQAQRFPFSRSSHPASLLRRPGNVAVSSVNKRARAVLSGRCELGR